jgi:hypothetical protein
MSLGEIGKIYQISRERVRQLLLPPPKKLFCKKHNHTYVTCCHYCKRMSNHRKNYSIKLRQLKKRVLLNEIIRLSKRDRAYQSSEQRGQLIQLLYDKYDFSFLEIGRLLNRHHTSVINLYYKNHKK